LILKRALCYKNYGRNYIILTKYTLSRFIAFNNKQFTCLLTIDILLSIIFLDVRHNAKAQPKQKQVVSKIVKEADHPLTIQEVLNYGKAHLPNLGIATVYREINRLCELEEIKTVNIPGDPLRLHIVTICESPQT
jgi:hypothetical protein